MSIKSEAAKLIRRALSPVHTAGCWLPKNDDTLLQLLTDSGLSKVESGAICTAADVERYWSVWQVADANAAKQALIAFDPMEIFPMEDTDI